MDVNGHPPTAIPIRSRRIRTATAVRGPEGGLGPRTQKARRSGPLGAGGQGRGRTGDLPLFRRTLVPTELPDRACRSLGGEWHSLKRRLFDLGGSRTLAGQQCLHIACTVTPVAAQCADTGQFPCLRPTSHGLRVNTKHRGYFTRCQQTFWILGHGRHPFPCPSLYPAGHIGLPLTAMRARSGPTLPGGFRTRYPSPTIRTDM